MQTKRIPCNATIPDLITQPTYEPSAKFVPKSFLKTFEAIVGL